MEQSKDTQIQPYSNTIEKIKDLNIVDEIGGIVKLSRTGSAYKGCCPFHNEKTPSFVVWEKTSTWHCFGCHKGGDLISFVEEHDGLSFHDAIKKICESHGWQMPQNGEADEARDRRLRIESLQIVNTRICEYFQKQLYLAEHATALEYLKSRNWTDETIRLLGIGYAPGRSSGLELFAKEMGINIDLLHELSLLIKEEGKKPYESFRDRIMFPIHSKSGKVVGFTGRKIREDNSGPKYLNSRDSEVFSKGQTLFNISNALKPIREANAVYLVEGPGDVARLYDIGVLNAACPCGTALTEEQVGLLSNLCSQVFLIFDGDQAGQKAIERTCPLFLKKSIIPQVVILPKGPKSDPDSFFLSRDKFDNYLKNNSFDYLIWKTEELKKKSTNNSIVAESVKTVCDLLSTIPDKSIIKAYLEDLAKILKPKSLWQGYLSAVIKEEKTNSGFGMVVPKHVDANDFERYGFYENSNCYFFRTKTGITKGSNFIMKPLFHVQSLTNSKRIYKIVNEHNKSEVIELAQRDLVSQQGFMVRVESLGNFLWEGTESDLKKLKRFLYERTDTCIEITQLGWQKEGFWAWVNGIYCEEFLKINEFGIVRFRDKNYYIPGLSPIYSSEEGLFQSERRFIYIEGTTTLFEYSSLLREVFGDNAMVSLCFYFACLFRDVIVRTNNNFPILNLFGPKGTGKSELALSLLSLFGRAVKGPDLTNTTKAALADHIAQRSNTLVHIDEYKNSVEFEKVAFLKGIYDGTGRTRMNMDKDKKNETTSVNVGVCLTGQELPTADIALFHRLIYLSFTKDEYSDQEQKLFDKLKEIEKNGLTSITHEVLRNRAWFVNNYLDCYNRASDELRERLKKFSIEERILRNWSMITAAFYTLEDKLKIAFSKHDLIEFATKQIITQQKETRTSGEISTFWSLVDFMYSDHHIQEGVDFKIKWGKISLTIGGEVISFPEPRNLLFIQHSRIIPLYRKFGKLNDEKILPVDSIQFYLRNDPRFIGICKAEKFHADITKAKVKVTTAYVFDYDKIGIALHEETKDTFRSDDELDQNKPQF